MRALGRALARIVGKDHVFSSPEARLVYECDMLTHIKGMPELVVLPASAGEVARVVKRCHEDGTPIVARGSGSGLAGGAAAPGGGVVVGLNRMNRILDIDLPNRCATVEAGVINQSLTDRVAPSGYLFAPDPSSQMVSTLGGNAATNAGGPHCLKKGTTVNHVLAAQVVTEDGRLLWVGTGLREGLGYDLAGAVVGSEGTLGLITALKVRLVHAAESVKTFLASFASVQDACAATTAILARGVVPTALEMMDADAIRIVEDGVGAGYPRHAGAVLLVEMDGPAAEVDAHAGLAQEACRRSGAQEIRLAQDAAERARLWKGRKSVAGAFGRLGLAWLLQDIVVPRSRLPDMAKALGACSARHGVRMPTVSHAGDGNLHPLFCYQPGDEASLQRALRASDEILHVALDLGGSVTGEHGVGLDKRDKLTRQFAPADLEFMCRVRQAFSPRGHLNPGKVLPMGIGCGDLLPRVGPAEQPSSALDGGAWI